MRKFIGLMFCVFFIFSSFAVAFNTVSASALVEDSWTTKTPMSQARYGLGVVAVDGKIYAIGGWADDGVFVDTNECYDPVSDTWVTLKPMPTPRHGFAIAAYQGKIYCIGGQTRDASGMRIIVCTTEVYDIATNSWSTKEPLSVGGTYLHAGTVDGKIFVLVESDIALFDRRQALYMYDPVNDSWTKKATMSEISVASIFVVLAVVGDKIIVNGEFRIESSSSVRYDYKVMIYDSKTDVWREGTIGSRGIHFGAAASTTGVYAPQRVYVMGLTSGSDFASLTNRAYDLETGVWSAANDMPTLRKGFGVAVVDDILYVIGGYTSDDFSSFIGTFEPIALNEQYVPSGYYGAATSQPGGPKISLDYFVVAVLVIVILGAVAVPLFLHFKKQGKLKKQVGS